MEKNFTEARITITKDASVPVCSTLAKLELKTLSKAVNGIYRGSFQNVKLTMDGTVTGRSAPIWETSRCDFCVSENVDCYHLLMMASLHTVNFILWNLTKIFWFLLQACSQVHKSDGALLG